MIYMSCDNRNLVLADNELRLLRRVRYDSQQIAMSLNTIPSVYHRRKHGGELVFEMISPPRDTAAVI